VSLVALSALFMPTTVLQAQEEAFTATTVERALGGFAQDFRRSSCFLERFDRPLQVAIVPLAGSSKFTEPEEQTITDQVEEVLAADDRFQVLPRRLHAELEEALKDLGESKSLAPSEQLDGIIVVGQRPNTRTVTVVAYAYKNGRPCTGPTRSFAAGKIVQVPDIPEKLFDRAARKLPDKNIERVVVMTADVNDLGNSFPAQVMGQRFQVLLADAINQIFRNRAQLSPKDAGPSAALVYVDGMDVSGAWQANLRFKQSQQGGIDVRVEFRSPGNPPIVIPDNGYLARDVLPPDSDPAVAVAAEAACRRATQALETQSDPDALQALVQENPCPRLRADLVKKVQLQRDRKERETAIAKAVDLGALTGSRTARVESTDRAVVWKFEMTEADTVKVRLDDLTVNLDIDLRDSSFEVIARPRQSGPPVKDIETAGKLTRGTYYLRIAPADGKRGSAYTLRVARGALSSPAVPPPAVSPPTVSPPTVSRPEIAAPAPFSRFETAAQATIGAAPSVLTHSLTANNVDYYARFTLSERTPVSIDLTWGDRQTDLDLYLYKDEGGPQPKYQIRSASQNTTSESLSRDLDPGTYFVKVKRESGSSPTMRFELSLRIKRQASIR
jgi:hypothetical protein